MLDGKQTGTKNRIVNHVWYYQPGININLPGLSISHIHSLPLSLYITYLIPLYPFSSYTPLSPSHPSLPLSLLILLPFSLQRVSPSPLPPSSSSPSTRKGWCRGARAGSARRVLRRGLALAASGAGLARRNAEGRGNKPGVAVQGEL